MFSGDKSISTAVPKLGPFTQFRDRGWKSLTHCGLLYPGP
jgi:hypothetical protein